MKTRFLIHFHFSQDLTVLVSIPFLVLRVHMLPRAEDVCLHEADDNYDHRTGNQPENDRNLQISVLNFTHLRFVVFTDLLLVEPVQETNCPVVSPTRTD
jgi:hypothetical protein